MTVKTDGVAAGRTGARASRPGPARAETAEQLSHADRVAELTRRELLKTTGAAAVSVGVFSLRGPASTQPPAGAWNHDPASPIGPLHWGEIGFPTCGRGMSQSPVNITAGSVAPYHGFPLLLRYESSELAIENTGHAVEVPIPAGVNDTPQIGGDCYDLVQYHFHAPSGEQGRPWPVRADEKDSASTGGRS